MRKQARSLFCYCGRSEITRYQIAHASGLALEIFTIANPNNFQILNSGKSVIVVMSEYKVGIIGYGWAATAHIEAINATSQGQVAAVYSSRPLDGAALSAQYGG